ncbi:uncharacterized protein isoform X4 [Musca autumnalis]|uniref:uncharacterized protein isoform X4 n=1 Tax=Musca autumnalis TaxID=221902 RepID=UPI003CF7536C
MLQENDEDYQKERFLYILLMTVNVSITLVVMLAACLCCKKKLPKNDLLGLEGMVKLKNPDEVVVVTQINASESHVDLNNSTVSQGDSEKRASTAAHRSLPDIPVAEANGDTGSELYETVADKMLMDAQNQNKSPTPSLKKQISVSQHSSISQADDVSSPYSRVKNSPHDYAKVRPTEHPYAQLNAPSTSHLASSAASSNSIVDGAQSQQQHHHHSHHTSGTQLNASNSELIHQQRISHHSDNNTTEHANDNGGQHEAEIPAASAIAGMISASQDLPYMTPPIGNQHFSGDSQDSSSYTSISVREPLANILAQQPPAQPVVRAAGHSRDVNDSHYATVSDDSGSPKPEKRQANSPLPPTPKSNISSSSTQLQALSSSNLTSGRNSVISVIECAGELMEEGVTDVPQDSSPQRRNKSLSPSKDIEGMYAKVMKKNKFSRNSPSSQNSSPIMQRKHNADDSASALGVTPLDKLESAAYTVNSISDRRIRSNSYGASKDHGYETIPADAMRGNSTQGVMENRKSDGYAHILQKERQRENVHTSSVPPINVYSVQLNNSDKHYETIAQPPNTSSNDPGYETLEKPKNPHHQQRLLQDDCEKKSSDYDPNYEVLKGPANSAGASDDGYAKVLEKKNVLVDGEDSLDGYSKVRGENETAAGYSTIADVKRTDANHNYASILETKREAAGGNLDDNQLETDSDHYARIAEKSTGTEQTTTTTTIRTPPNLPLSVSQKSMVDEELLTPRTTTELSITSPTSITSSSMLNTTSSINSTSTNLTTTSTISSRQTPTSSSQYESLTGSETDPNYESVCYVNASGHEEENPYERLHTEVSDDITQLSSPEASTNTAGTATTTTTTTSSSNSTSSNSSAAAMAEQQHSKMLKANGSKINISQDNTANDILVDDYFQV